jgi:RNA recognition motif-containing protein
MTTKLYVGNLPYTSTDQDLKDLFSEAGSVASAQVIIDRNTNQSRGFGFVEMSSDEEARNAISILHGRQNAGRSLVVNESKPRESNGGGGGGRGGYGGGGYGGGGGRSNRY